jgi:hypothetical protein
VCLTFGGGGVCQIKKIAGPVLKLVHEVYKTKEGKKELNVMRVRGR